MTVDVVIYVGGIALIILAVLGGGIEVRDVKIPPLTPVTRILAAICGVSLLIFGVVRPNPTVPDLQGSGVSTTSTSIPPVPLPLSKRTSQIAHTSSANLPPGSSTAPPFPQPKSQALSDWLSALAIQPGEMVPSPKPIPYGAQWTDEVSGHVLRYPKEVAGLPWQISEIIDNGTATKIEYFREAASGYSQRNEQFMGGDTVNVVNRACSADHMNDIRSRLAADFGEERGPPMEGIDLLDTGSNCSNSSVQQCKKTGTRFSTNIKFKFKPGWQVTLWGNRYLWTWDRSNSVSGEDTSDETHECDWSIVISRDVSE